MEAERMRGGGCTVNESAPISVRAPSLPSSVAIAVIRSVSFTRQFPMPRSVVGPWAKSEATARVMAASGMVVRSASMPSRGPSPSTSMAAGSKRACAPMRASTSANRASPCRLSDPQPSTRTLPPVMAAPARKYEADDASPSTRTLHASAEARHEGEGHRHVGLGDQPICDLENDGRRGERGRHQERREELAARGAAEARGATAKSARLDGERRIAVPLEAVDARAELLEA